MAKPKPPAPPPPKRAAAPAARPAAPQAARKQPGTKAAPNPTPKNRGKTATAPVKTQSIVAAPPATEPRGPGQPAHVPDDKTRAKVTAWSGGGIELALIAKSLGISDKTLTKHYGPQLATGKATMDGLAISTLALAMQRGGKEAVVAAKWWTQSRMGWTERLLIDDGKPTDAPMRVIIELVGDAPADRETATARTRQGFDASNLVDLVG